MHSLQKGIMKYIVTAGIQNKNDNPITINRIFDNLMFRSVSFLLWISWSAHTERPVLNFVRILMYDANTTHKGIKTVDVNT